MAADLFETYAVTIVATMVLASIFSPQDYNLMIYLSYRWSCIVTSIIGTWFVKLGKTKILWELCIRFYCNRYYVIDYNVSGY